MPQKNKKKTRWFVASLIFLLFIFVVAFGREYVGNIQVQHYIAELEEQKEMQETEQLETMALIQELSSEYFLEQEARVKQGLGRDGETVVVIQEEEVEEEYQIQEMEGSVSNVRGWFYYFFSNDKFQELKHYAGS